MAGTSKIEWTDASWNPVVGCSIVSPGCTNCYAMKMAARIEAMAGAAHYTDTTKKVNGNAVWTGKVQQAPDKVLLAPLGWRKPKRVFVNSMGDLFHESIPDEWIDRVFTVMALCPQHTFQVLTKRAHRMREYCSTIQKHGRWLAMEDVALTLGYAPRGRDDHGFDWISNKQFLRNVWLGVSCERQQEADERIPHLLQTPAAIRFISAEPLLGPIDLKHHDLAAKCGLARPLEPACKGGSRLDWVIVGGESGSDARPMHPDWARSLRDQCSAAGVAFFFKQHGEWCPLEANSSDPNGKYQTRLVAPDGKHISDGDVGQCDFPNASRFVYRLGKKLAGRLLDGREHNEFPR